MSMFPNMESTDELKQIMFLRGLKEGIKLFAWWKDSVQYVGTCGTTLKQALEDIDAGKYDNLVDRGA